MLVGSRIFNHKRVLRSIFELGHALPTACNTYATVDRVRRCKNGALLSFETSLHEFLPVVLAFVGLLFSKLLSVRGLDALDLFPLGLFHLWR